MTTPLRLGVLAPLTRPGWTEAGRHLLAGIELAVRETNDAGGIRGRRLETIVRDTAADPERAATAVEEFEARGAAAVAGEYHSVVARTAATRAAALGIPYLCSSAVLDDLTGGPTEWVARIAPAQSRGWRLYADHLLDGGRRRIAAAVQPGAYWACGARILTDRLAARGGTLRTLDGGGTPEELCDALAEHRADTLLLLVGHPEPAVPLVRAVRADRRLGGVLIGAPAGQPELADWAAALGGAGTGVPFLRYRPERLGTLGARVAEQLRARLGGAPSFVALEGWDTVTVLAEVLRSHGTDRASIAAAWSAVSVEGTRGTIRFSRVPGLGIRQWAWPDIHVVDRDPADPERIRTLRAG